MPPYSLAIHVPAGGRHVCCVPNSEIASLFNSFYYGSIYAQKEERLRSCGQRSIIDNLSTS